MEKFNLPKIESGEKTPEISNSNEANLDEKRDDYKMWESTESWAEIIGTSPQTFKKIASKYVEQYPDDLKKFGKKVFRYSPKIAELVKKEIHEIPKASPDEKTITKLETELGFSPQTNSKIKKLIKQYREDHPDWIVIKRDKAGNPREHCTQQLIDAIKNEVSNFVKNEMVDEDAGEITNRLLAKKLGIDKATLKKIAGKYIEDHPDWVVLKKDKSGRVNKQYSKNLADLLEEEVKNLRQKPENGEKTNKKLTRELGVSKDKIDNIVNKYRSGHPSWFVRLLDNAGNPREHYVAELVQIIKSEVEEGRKKILSAPENWKTKEDISRETGIPLEDIIKASAKLKKEFPDKFGKFKDKE